MYQKCPICNGSGIVGYVVLGKQVPCDVCKGKKIISQLTGKPPKKAEGQSIRDPYELHREAMEELRLKAPMGMSDKLNK